MLRLRCCRDFFGQRNVGHRRKWCSTAAGLVWRRSGRGFVDLAIGSDGRRRGRTRQDRSAVVARPRHPFRCRWPFFVHRAARAEHRNQRPSRRCCEVSCMPSVHSASILESVHKGIYPQDAAVIRTDLATPLRPHQPKKRPSIHRRRFALHPFGKGQLSEEIQSPRLSTSKLLSPNGTNAALWHGSLRGVHQ